jgi:hypothetical protein
MHIRKKYMLDLENVMEKHRIDPATIRVIKHCMSRWFINETIPKIDELVPDASRTLIKAYNEQCEIGWDHWLKGRISMEWGTLVNYDINHKNSNIRYNSVEKWAKEVILLNWELAHNIWLSRNQNEHDSEGNPTERIKEKLIEEILGISRETEYRTYSKEELKISDLKKSPTDNLKIILINIKNDRTRRNKKRKKK